MLLQDEVRASTSLDGAAEARSGVSAGTVQGNTIVAAAHRAFRRGTAGETIAARAHASAASISRVTRTFHRQYLHLGTELFWPLPRNTVEYTVLGILCNTVLHTDEGPILLRILNLTPTVLYAS